MVVTDGSPSTKATLGSNAVHVTARYDARTEHGDRDRRPRQPRQGRQRRRRAGRQRRARPRRDRRPHQGRRRTVIDARQPQKAAVLVEALPYIRRFAGKVVVVKYGGNALAGTTEHDALGAVRRGHRADAAGRHAPGRRARRRPADQRSDDAARQAERVPQRPAGHRRRDRRHRPHGADRSGQPADRERDQRPRQLRRRRQRRGRRPDPGLAPRPRARLRRRRRGDQSRSAAAGCSTTSSSRSSPRSAPTPAARRTTSTPTPWPARSPRRSAPRSSSTSPTSRACAASSTTRRRLIRQTTADELDALIADGTIAGGMIPKVESCIARRAQRRAQRPHPRRPRSPTCCCSRSSPTRGSARCCSKGRPA